MTEKIEVREEQKRPLDEVQDAPTAAVRNIEADLRWLMYDRRYTFNKAMQILTLAYGDYAPAAWPPPISR